MWSPVVGNGIRVAGCRFHNLAVTAAVSVVALATVVNNVVVENNMFWDCRGGPGGLGTFGLVSIYNGGPGCTVRNNTIVHLQNTLPYAVIYHRSSTDALAEFEGNVILYENDGTTPAFNSNIYPSYADFNVALLFGQATMFGLAPTWNDWQGNGMDPNGFYGDPLLVNVAPGQEDLRLLPSSPARDLVPSSTLAADVFGNPRPFGAGYDAGAHEFSNFPAVAGVAAGSAFSGPAGGPFVLSVSPGGTLIDARIEFKDAEAETIALTAITPPSPGMNGVATPAIPAPGHPVLLEWTGVSDLTNAPGTYTWIIEFTDAGSGYPMSCTVSITIPPLAITTASPLPKGDVGIPYAQTILFENATGTAIFTVQSGNLPPGVNLSVTGDITGTPAQDGAFNFTIQAVDSFTTVTQVYDLQIYPAAPPVDPAPNGDSDSGCSVSSETHSLSHANRALALAALVLLVGIVAACC
jgi:hypothetical protein